MTPWPVAARYFETDAVAHLATVDTGGGPHVTPLWMDRHGDTDLVFFTEAGSRKDRNIALDPRVAVSVTSPEDAYDMATVRGSVVERLEGEAAMEVVDRISQTYTGAPYEQRSGFVAFVVRPRTWWARDYSTE